MSQEVEFRLKAEIAELQRRIARKNSFFKALGDRLKVDESKAPDDGGVRAKCLELAREGYKS